jgi:adenine-specific DNA glycosylase
MRIPPAKPRPKAREEHHHAVVIVHERHGGVLVERRDHSGMWAGLWQVPTIEGLHPLTPREVASRVLLGSRRALAKRCEFVHKTTHRHIRFHVYTTNSRSDRGEWRSPRDLVGLPMSSAQRRIFALLNENGGDGGHNRQSTKRAQGKPIDRVSLSLRRKPA